MSPSVCLYVTGTIITFTDINPVHHQWKCTACSIGANYSNFRACSEPEVFQRHLQESTDFEGTINACDKVWMECYWHSLIISRIKRAYPAIQIFIPFCQQFKIQYLVYHSASSTAWHCYKINRHSSSPGATQQPCTHFTWCIPCFRESCSHPAPYEHTIVQRD